MSARRARWLTAAGVVAAIVVAISFVVFTSNDDESSGARRGPTGLAFVNGDYLAPPYAVVVAGPEVRINDRTARSREPALAAPAPFDVPAAPNDADDVLAVLGARFAALGGANELAPSDATLRELTALARSFPFISDVRTTASAIEIDDRAGGSAALLLVREERGTGDEIAEALAVDAGSWQRLLDAGGLIFVSGGTVASVPPQAAEAYLDGLIAAFDAPSERVLGELIALTGALQLSSALLDAGPPPRELIPSPNDASRASTAASLPRPARPALVAAIGAGFSGHRVVAVHGAHDTYQTPKTNKAYLFTPASEEGIVCHTGPVVEAAQLHGYTVIQFDGAASNIAEFAASSGRAGIFYSCIHGGTSYEKHPTRAAATAAQARYKEQGLGGTAIGSLDDGAKWYVMTTSRFLEMHWQSAGTIAWVDGCGAANLHSQFNAREYISLFELCYPGNNEGLLQDFWGRLAGTKSNGAWRPVGVAFQQVLSRTPFQLFGDGGGMTVLSPAVRSFQPQEDVLVSPTVPLRGVVQFDARMDQGPRTALLIGFEGEC